MFQRLFQKRLRPLIAATALLGACVASAQTKLDISLPWGPNEFHSLNAAKFAARVKEETQGQVLMSTHPGGTLGVKANESLRSIGEGVVPIGEFALFQNASRGASLAVETLPFLVDDYDQLRTLHKSFRPIWDGVMARNNVKVLYVVPWPNQFFFLKKPASSLKDLSGMKMRSLDRLTTDWINRLGMVPVQMTNPEILQALGSGMIDGVPTSAGTAVAQKYWDFMKYGYQTNHIWSSNAMVINLDTWKKLTPAQQAAIDKVAHEMEPQFWENSRQDHEKKVAELKANGMTVVAAPKSMVDDMKAATAAQWPTYVKPMGDDSAAALAEYRKLTKK